MTPTYSKGGGAPLRCRGLRLRPSPQRGQWRLPDHSQQQISRRIPSLLPRRATADGRGEGPTTAAAADPADAAVVVRVLSHSRTVTGDQRRPDGRFCAAIFIRLSLLLLLQNGRRSSQWGIFAAILLLASGLLLLLLLL